MYDLEAKFIIFVYLFFGGGVGLIELCYDVLGVLIGLWMKIYKIELPGWWNTDPWLQE